MATSLTILLDHNHRLRPKTRQWMWQERTRLEVASARLKAPWMVRPKIVPFPSAKIYSPPSSPG